MTLTPILIDAKTRREAIRSKAVEALKQSFPLTLRGHTLELSDVKVQEREFGPEEQKQALLEGSTLHEPVRGTLTLRDAAGAVKETAKNFLLLRLPYFTERHTFLVDGNEYQVSNQLRMKPGVYTRRRGNEELEAAFNLSKGSNFRLSLDPQKGHPFMEYGTTRIPLYPILRKLGATHAEIAKHWGADVAQANATAYEARQETMLEKLYGRIIHPAKQTATTSEGRLDAVKATYALTAMDGDVNAVTLGNPHSEVTPAALLDASKKLLQVYKSGDEVDDRDSLAFKTFHGVDGFIKERILLDARAIAMKVKGRAASKTTLREIVPSAPFSAGVRAFLTGSQLSAIPTQINPMEMIDNAVKVTSLGEGGISSERAVPMEARQLHPTHLGMLDACRTPESFQAGVNIRTSILAHHDEHGNLYTPVKNLKTGEHEYLSARQMADAIVAFPGGHEAAKHPTGAIAAMRKGQVEYVPKKDVQYALFHPSQLYSPTTNLIPMLESIQGNRATMGSKFQTQALPLVEREEPWVQVGVRQLTPEGKEELTSFESQFARLIVPTSPVAGRIAKIDHQYIYIDPGHKKASLALPAPLSKHAGEVKQQKTIKGVVLRFELLPGDTRRGKNKKGEAWEKTMTASYGWIAKSLGDDGEATDVYYADKEDASHDDVFVVDQVDADGKHDEDKVIIGCSTEEEARKLYIRHTPARYLGSIKRYSWDEFVDDYLESRQRPTSKAAAEGGDDSHLIKVPYETNFPFASKTYLTQTLHVKEGDHVKEDQTLGDSNFTKDGVLALGRNMKVGYMAYYGLNSNDAVVISEGAAQKLTSEHLYKEVMDVAPDIRLGKEVHRQNYGSKYTTEQYSKLDSDGVVKKGSKVMPHDILICGVRKGKLSAADALLGNLRRSLANPYREEMRDWHHDFEGEVLDVYKSDRRVVVTIRTREPMRIGDKLAQRHGAKGVVSHVVPDAKMVQDESGAPIDILYTSQGVISRINPAQVMEVAVAKVAQKMGKPIIMENFTGRDNVKWAKALCKEHGVKDKERVFDPISGRHIDGIMVGPQYTFRMFKTTDSNYAARGVGGYDVNRQPTKGGETGAKGLGMMEVNALISHNARNVLKESATIKSQDSDEYWRAAQLGLPLPSLKSSFAFDKMIAMLHGAGIRVDKTGSVMTLLPLTDAETKKMSTGAILNEKLVRAKDLVPEKGGFFDLSVTGGTTGTHWSHVNLAEPIVSPVFVEPVRRLLGMTTKAFDEAHDAHGGKWFKDKLKKIDVEAKLGDLRRQTKTLSSSKLDDAIKQIKYLEALKRAGLAPHEAYVISKLPVLPPVMRPILPGNGGQELVVGDPNYLYQNMFLHNKALAAQVEDPILPPDEHAILRHNLFQAVGAVVGTHETDNPKLEKRNVKGFLEHLTGKTTPKSSFFQRKLMKRQQDLSGRGTAAPDGSLGMDEIGLPEDMLWTMFGKFVVKRLVQRGFPAVAAAEMVEKKHPAARDALLAEIAERPVIMNRAPTLHRYGMVGAYATPVAGKTIRVNAFVEAGLGLDYDGDDQISTVIFFVDSGTVLPDYVGQEVPLIMETKIREQVGYELDGRFYICALEDFPHTEKLGTKDHITFYGVPEGVRVIAHDAATQRLRLKPVTGWSVHRDRSVEIVTLASNRQLVTDDDERAVYGVTRELELVRRRPSEAVGVFVPRARHLERMLLDGAVASVANPSTAPDTYSTITLDVRFGHLCGLLAGNGWCGYVRDALTGHVSLATTDDGVAAQFHLDLLTVLREPPHVGEVSRDASDNPEDGFGASNRLVVARRSLASFIAPLIGRGARNKHLPSFFLFGPREFRLGLLAGLIDTDGCISVSHGKKKPQWMTNYSTTSIRLAQEVVLLARSLNVNAAISPCLTPGKLPAWTVTFSAVEMHLLGALPVSHSEKRPKFAEFFGDPEAVAIGSSAYGRTDVVPIPNQVAVIIAANYRQGSMYTTFRVAAREGQITRGTARRALRERPQLRSDVALAPWIRLVDSDDVTWDRVESSVKTGIPETGYDLTVPGYETFMNVEGIVLSNTLQIHTPVQPAAVEDVKRMTLSKLLFGDKTRDSLMVAPTMEAVLGLHLASKKGDVGAKVHKYATKEDALHAYQHNEIKLDDFVEIA